MRSVEKFIVLDCEGMSGQRPYNIGFIIADKYGKIYKKYSFAFPENVYINIKRSADTGQAVEMTARNVQEILEDFKNPFFNRKYKCVSVEYFKSLFIKVINKYHIKRLFAYNVSFDKACIKNLYGDDFVEVERLIEFCDILPCILYTKLLTSKYVSFCIENGFLTEKGYIQTKAETVYKYLKNDINFVEEHTGLSDVFIEYEILLVAFKTKKKLKTAPCQGWKVLDNFCKEKGLKD